MGMELGIVTVRGQGKGYRLAQGMGTLPVFYGYNFLVNRAPDKKE